MNITKLKNELNVITKSREHVLSQLEEYDDIKNDSLVLKKSNKCYQYYHKNSNGKLEYIIAAERELAKRLAQKEYYEKLLNSLFRQEREIRGFIAKYNSNCISEIYENMPEGRKVLVNPIIESEKEFINKWMARMSGGKNTYNMETSYATDNGEEVRSKSEKILADIFCKYGLIYQYEPEIMLYNGVRCYPDFAILNIKERKTYYWEHFGLVSNSDYADKNLEKLARYEKSGIILGDNLLVSFEAKGIGLDVQSIEDKIIRYLL